MSLVSSSGSLSLPSAQASPGLRVAEALAFSFVIGLCAQIRIALPFTPVPITGQTLAVLGAGAVLGSRFGVLAVLFYLAEGILGLPFFAGGASGGGHFFGPTAGYLLGFLPAAGLTGWLAARGWDRTPARAAAMTALGSGVVFACGLAGLAGFVPAGALLQAGLLPFLPGDFVKIAIAAAAVPAWRRIADGIESGN
ncbi:MAG: biotin transporter BioY [Elusimicrobia bacterium]|nr:biotin transporter BioY [Elusimicrobiota bacterium]